MKVRAKFRLETIKSAEVVIRDLGPWDRHPTVTNDAEAVVAFLWSEMFLQKGQRLFYFDSDGNLDELLHIDGEFMGFAPGPRSAPN